MRIKPSSIDLFYENEIIIIKELELREYILRESYAVKDNLLISIHISAFRRRFNFG